ncbi:MAG: molecular chaperone DjiA [Rhodobacteraceae bacterium]|nr:molecular chaperone DjiA [Paracoccaceae bacterium]
MSIWTRISEAIAALTSGEGLTAVFDRLTTPPERSVGFTIAVIALGAKMAKADGHVTRDEVVAFRQIFQIADADEAQAAKVFNLARQDVAGFESYAAKVAKMFKDDRQFLTDLLEGLFHIAMADGNYHPKEDEFLGVVAKIFDLPDALFQCLRTRYVPGLSPDPYSVLGVAPDFSLDQIRANWRRLVKANHPDLLTARGLPAEAVALATTRLANINRAWEDIQNQRQPIIA